MIALRSVRSRVIGASVALALVGASDATAQGATCEILGSPAVAPLVLTDACRKAEDLFVFLAPQVGVALSGGNVLLGEGGTLGGWGKRSAVLRVTAVDGRIPDNVITLNPTGPVSSDFGAARAPVPVPALDLGIGLFRGVPVGLTNVGGVDLLVGVTFVPSVRRDEFNIMNEGSALVGTLGVRVGVLQESALVPGVALSVMRRRLPATSVTYRTANDTLGVFNTRVASTVYRLTVNKRFGLFGIGGGLGQDELDTRTNVEAIINESVAGQPVRTIASLRDARDRASRGTAFANVSFGLARAQLVAEIGRSRAGSLRETLNTFGDRRANEAYTYGSVGIGVRF
ncbi:MAG: hypothetical protein MUD17_01825 [Gemmatimonadaceae bacterium]|nr:hypothetical protein [Gemmatimonadaceae bacterium]